MWTLFLFEQETLAPACDVLLSGHVRQPKQRKKKDNGQQREEGARRKVWGMFSFFFFFLFFLSVWVGLVDGGRRRDLDGGGVCLLCSTKVGRAMPHDVATEAVGSRLASVGERESPAMFVLAKLLHTSCEIQIALLKVCVYSLVARLVRHDAWLPQRPELALRKELLLP